ncbi:hypothetical protein KC320_g66 [Hortaea werneckii]|nr:hypothetical protein KC320_g66 [Hortaea werneckii]
MPAHWRFHHQAVRHSAAAPSVSSLVVAIRCYEFGIVVIKAVVVARRHRIVATRRDAGPSALTPSRVQGRSHISGVRSISGKMYGIIPSSPLDCPLGT